MVALGGDCRTAVQDGGGGWMLCTTVAPAALCPPVVTEGNCTTAALDYGMMTTPDGGGTGEQELTARRRGANGGGFDTMDMDMEHHVADYTNYKKGTIQALFCKMHSKGAKTTTIQGRKEINGGGSRHTAKDLRTTMKKTRKSRTKMGITSMRGAKSTSGGSKVKLSRDSLSDSSQMEIGKYFFKLEGIIGPNKMNCGNPMGKLQIPLKTRGNL